VWGRKDNVLGEDDRGHYEQVLHPLMRSKGLDETTQNVPYLARRCASDSGRSHFFGKDASQPPPKRQSSGLSTDSAARGSRQ
jgi:hypothetical protein